MIGIYCPRAVTLAAWMSLRIGSPPLHQVRWSGIRTVTIAGGNSISLLGGTVLRLPGQPTWFGFALHGRDAGGIGHHVGCSVGIPVTNGSFLVAISFLQRNISRSYNDMLKGYSAHLG